MDSRPCPVHFCLVQMRWDEVRKDQLVWCERALSSGRPVATTVPLLHPSLTPSPEAHRRSDVTPYRKSSTVPASPCAMTSASRVMVSFKRRRPVASATFNSPTSTRSTTYSCNANKEMVDIRLCPGPVLLPSETVSVYAPFVSSIRDHYVKIWRHP